MKKIPLYENKKTFHDTIIDRLSDIKKKQGSLNKNKEQSLFGLNTIKPDDTDKVSYVNLGPLLGKELYNKFLDAVKKEMDISLDSPVYSRMCVEVSDIDGTPHIEISTNDICQLPIAGKQISVLEKDAEKADMDFDGYIDSLNFILNDTRHY